MEAAVKPESFIYSIKGSDTLRLDKYDSPAFPGEKPCVIFVFGGGFSAGTRDNKAYVPFYEQLVHNGYVVIAIDYRLGMKNVKERLDLSQSESNVFDQMVEILGSSIESAIEDLFDATHYVLEHAAEWHIRPDGIVACGSSAGAVTVLQGEYEICNRTFLSSRLPQGFNYAGIIAFAGAILSNGDLNWANNPAPIQLFHGDADRNVPFDSVTYNRLGLYGSKYIANRLDKMKMPFYFYEVENVRHEMADWPMTQNWDEINTFLKKQVFGKENLRIHTVVSPTDKPVLDKKLEMKDIVGTNYF
jgi:predicted esterase